MKKYFDLFITFFKIGLFTFGGGYAMIGVMEETVVEKKKWLESDEMMQLITISESTPGPFAINAATFIGYKHSKVLGSILATLGVVLPSFIIIIIISLSLDKFKEILIIQNALKGISAGVSVLILSALFNLGRKENWNLINIIIAIIAFTISFFTNFNIVFLMLIGIIISIITFYIKNYKNVEGEKNE